MEYKMHVEDKVYDDIKAGNKTIEMRLYDEKRREFKTGDIIIFKNRKNDSTLKCKITNLYHYNNFEELYKHHDKLALGYKENDVASPADMNIYYDYDKINKYGVLAIEIRLI
jgi:ASC-1-like (ASCH) protein